MPDLHDSLQRALASRNQRRRMAQAAASLGGGLLLSLAASRTGPFVIAQSDDDDDDHSGRGRGRGRGGDEDNSGPGNAEDRAEAAAVQAEIPPGSIEIRIVSDDAGGFVPGELTVDVGQSVTFVNAHSDEHTATGSGFDTGIIPEGTIATVVLDTPGTFRYACQIHPEMTGRIDVRDENGIVPQATPAPASTGGETVRIANLAFTPADLAVPLGATVTWSNEDAVPHTATADDGSFDSGIFDPGASFAQTYDQPCSFPYHCELHTTMQGTIRVGDEAGAVSAQPAASPPATEPLAQATPAAEGATVSIVDFAFEPQELQIAAGTSVTWTNSGGAPHTVTGDWASSDILQPGQTFTHTFDADGRFAYVCAIHPEMTGEVVVGPPAAAEADLPAGSTAEPAGVWSLSRSLPSARTERSPPISSLSRRRSRLPVPLLAMASGSCRETSCACHWSRSWRTSRVASRER